MPLKKTAAMPKHNSPAETENEPAANENSIAHFGIKYDEGIENLIRIYETYQKAAAAKNNIDPARLSENEIGKINSEYSDAHTAFQSALDFAPQNMVDEMYRRMNELKMKEAETNGHRDDDGENGSRTLEIFLDHFKLSPLPSQKRRRSRFVEDQLAELADSIRRHGVLQAIVVRALGATEYEIVAGERRFLASKIAGLEKIPAVVKELSDTDAAEIQLIENGQRVDQHPLDEAFDYQDMKTVLGYDETEIALRVGKPVGYVLNRLKLTGLSGKAKEYFEQNKIPLSHALEICKYPAHAHDEIFSFIFDGFRTEAVYPLQKFISQIQQHYLLQLKKAPFSTKSGELRADGLPCVKCPERTNANPLLFEENYSDKDCCLNRDCWEAKTKAHIRIQRRKIAETDLKVTDPEKMEKAVAKVPLISKEHWVRDHEKPGEKYIARDDFKEVKKPDECKSAKRGVFFNGDRVGQTALICANKDCVTHFGKNQYVANTAAGDPEAASEARRIRKEEIFDSRVAENVRRRVLKKSSEWFTAENTIYTHEKSEGFQNELLAKLWTLQCNYSEHTAKIICEVLELDDAALKPKDWGIDHRAQILALPAEVRSRLMFLLLVADQSEIFEAYWSYKSQKPIKDLASDFGVNYPKLDAEERLAQAPMKQKDVFRAFLEQIESGDKKAKPPRLWSNEWKPKD